MIIEKGFIKNIESYFDYFKNVQVEFTISADISAEEYNQLIELLKEGVINITIQKSWA